jgi:uncharacterized membrane protein YdjX (TVP38/TMEM64 family)
VNRVWLQRGAIVSVWIAAILGWRWFQRSEGLSTIETAQRLVDEIDGVWWGLLAYALAYLLRPLLLFPATVITVAAGLLFGPVVGVLIVIVAANASAMLAYGIGRLLAGERDLSSNDEDQAGLIARWGERMRTNSFESVFIMRLLFLPYDLVNYASGALRIRWTSFLLATILGTLPGTIAFVLLGASIERLDEGLGGINPWTIVASVVIFIASLVIARFARQRGAADLDVANTDPEPVAATASVR